MAAFTRLVLILSVLVISVLAMPRPDGFDDEGEMSVPRSPKIQGPVVVNLPYTTPQEVKTLKCIIEGSPTPTVIWLKDGQEIQGTANLYTLTYDVTDGKAELYFQEIAKRDIKQVNGNFTCIAANFLGRVQKVFVIEVLEKVISPTPSTSTSTSENSITTLGVTNQSFSTEPTASSDAVVKNPATNTTSTTSPTLVTPEVTEPVPSDTLLKPEMSGIGTKSP